MKGKQTKALTKFISSQQTVDSETQRQVISLGKKLINELNLEKSNDTLSRWMVHYIAEQIAIIKAKAGNKIEKQKAYNTIIKLWKNRAVLPTRQGIIRDFKPVFELLRRINPKSPKTFTNIVQYLSHSKKKKQGSEKYLETISEIDSGIKVVYDFIIKSASVSALSKEKKEWIAKKYEEGDTIEIDIIATIISDLTDENSVSIEDKERSDLEKKIKKIELGIKHQRKILLSLKNEYKKL